MSNGYMTRALHARDPRFARILGKLGYERSDLQAKPTEEPDGDELVAARAEYAETVGKRAYHGWDINELREKIAAHKAG